MRKELTNVRVPEIYSDLQKKYEVNPVIQMMDELCYQHMKMQRANFEYVIVTAQWVEENSDLTVLNVKNAFLVFGC